MRNFAIVGLVVVTLGASLAPAHAQGGSGFFDAALPDLLPAAGPEGEIWLGRALFFDPRLSSTGTVSCATCHEPAQSFTDGLPQSVGEMGAVVGRNAPTLFGLHEDDLFIDPLRTSLGRFGQLDVKLDRNGEPETGPTAISLAERCLSPLGNSLEMGKDVDTTVGVFRDRTLSGPLFDRVFGAPGGVTRERVGQALAAYVGSLVAPEGAPYARYLAGETDALDPAAERGLAIFSGKGECATCHSGTSLRDGLVHATRPSVSLLVQEGISAVTGEATGTLGNGGTPATLPQMENPVARTGLVRIDAGPDAPRIQVIHGSRGGPGQGYGGLADFVSATPTLWDVSRTAPYFGDGSGEDLRSAVLEHMSQLRSVCETLDREDEQRLACANGNVGVAVEGQMMLEDPTIEVRRSRQAIVSSFTDLLAAEVLRAPELLRPPTGTPVPRLSPVVDDEHELDDLIAFLRALSS